MNYFSVRDLRTKPGKVWESLEETREAIITNNGKPSVLMISLTGRDAEEVIAGVRQAMAMKAIENVRLDAAKKGLDKLTDEEIDAEISAARQERRGK